jgi:high-affinity Fe2+/Pb2+ permease
MIHRRPDTLDLIAGLVVAVIVTIVGFVARHFIGAEHPLLLCVGSGVLFIVLMIFSARLSDTWRGQLP